MTEQSAPEPTMEEILASIRRIISEDDVPAADGESAPEAVAEAAVEEPAAAAIPEPAPLPEPAPAMEAAPEDDVLELTERVEAEPSETHGDLDVYTKEDPEPVVAPAPVTMAAPIDDDALVGEPASALAASSFGKLSAALAMPAAGRTLEDVVRELLRPLLKDWLDTNLPAIVQAKVDEEVERIARTRVR